MLKSRLIRLKTFVLKTRHRYEWNRGTAPARAIEKPDARPAKKTETDADAKEEFW